MYEKNQERDIYAAIADPARRKLLRLLADVEELPLKELTVHFEMGRTAAHVSPSLNGKQRYKHFTLKRNTFFFNV
ncbi:hypothetical protein VSK91_16450 [Bacillus swezeyi]|uniref:hypothetical protein n=1 Tax=Bacillus swezeyi TaxID=1925020 RepID=UPI0039C615C3